MNNKQMYIVALLGLGVLIFWVSRSQQSQFALINSIASPYNTQDPAKTDKKLHKMNFNKRIFPSLSLNRGEAKVETAKMNNAAKFPTDMDFTPVSQHESYVRHKGAVAASEQEETTIMIDQPVGYGDRMDIRAPGEKLEVY